MRSSRAQLVKIKRDLENQIRGLLKNHGLIIGKAGGNVFRRRVEELVGRHGLLWEAVHPLLDRQGKAEGGPHVNRHFSARPAHRR